MVLTKRKVAAVLLAAFATVTLAESTADPGVRDAAALDPRRPPAAELALRVPDGFTVTAVGDLITSRPLRQEAARLPGFKAVLGRLKRGDVLFGNMESTIFDVRHFSGAPYSYDGDWTNASLPAVAKDLREMGVDLVSRANYHVMDWGIEGMRETGRWLDEAGIVHAGAGETRGLARAPQYYETPARAWNAPAKATPYDLTAPLNAGSFAHDFTFHGVIAHCRFAHGELAGIDLDPLELGYGAPLTESGIPRLATDAKTIDQITNEILEMTRAYGLPALHLTRREGRLELRP